MKKKYLSLVLIFSMLMTVIMPSIVHAEPSIVLFQNRITVNRPIVTLYVGEISKEGESQFKYIYSDDNINAYALNYIKNSGILTEDYANLLPTTAGKVKVCTDSSITMSWIYYNASYAANNIFTGNVTDTSDTKLYNETKYNELVGDSQQLVAAEQTAKSDYDTAYNQRRAEWEAIPGNEEYDYTDVESYEPPVLTNNDLSSLTGEYSEYVIADEITRTGEDYYKYAMYNGRLVKCNLTDVNRTVVRIISTSANVTDIAGTERYPYKDGNTYNAYDITSDEVTLYVGNISVDETSQAKYLYTDKEVNEETLAEIRKILPEEYSSILPTTAGQVAVSNNNSLTVDDTYTDAKVVATKNYTGYVTDTSSNILYNQEEFNNLASASATEVSDEATVEAECLDAWNDRKNEWDAKEQEKENEDPYYTPVDFPEEYRYAFNDSTTYPTTSYIIADKVGNKSTGYFIRDGKVAKVNTYPVNRTIIKVVNTSANVDTNIQVLKGDLDKNGVVDANDASVALELYKAQNATIEDVQIGDMDENDLIDANDASLILEYYKTHQ